MKLQTINGNNDNNKVSTKSSNEAEKIFIVNMETGKILNEQNVHNIEECHQNNDEKNNLNSKNIEQPNTRTLRIEKDENGACGFHITRTKWDPYPWISCVDANTPAEISGLKVGDCVLEVNGEDVLGLRIPDIAKLVKCKSSHVTLQLWSAGCDAQFNPETLCDAPMPLTLQRLSIIVQSILSIIECPVCLNTISPPAMQCQNGHLLCVNCRIRADKCPVCRDHYTPRRALIAEQIYAAITSAFNLCRSEDKLRHKLFGTNVKHPQQQTENMSNNMVTTSQSKEIDSSPYCLGAEVCKSKAKSNGVSLPATNKFLTKLLLGKTCSMDNPSTATTQTAQTQPRTMPATSTATNPIAVTSNIILNSESQSSAGCLSSRNPAALNVMSAATASRNITNSNDPPRQSTTNQLNSTSTTANIVSKSNGLHLDGESLLKNEIPHENSMSKHISLSTDDSVQFNLVSTNELTTPALDVLIMAAEVKSNEQTLHYICSPHADIS